MWLYFILVLSIGNKLGKFFELIFENKTLNLVLLIKNQYLYEYFYKKNFLLGPFVLRYLC